MNPYLEAILKAADKAQDVRINTVKLEDFSAVWAKEKSVIPDWNMPVYPEVNDDSFVQFLGIGNALNYCFSDIKTGRKYETEYSGKSWRGAFGMWAALKRALEEGVSVLDADFLENISLRETRGILKGNPSMPIILWRLRCLRSAGAALNANFDGSYAELFRRCNYRAFNDGEGIIEQLVKYDSCYSDTTCSKSLRKNICFHKRANLFVMMYHGRALVSNGALPLIEDADELTPPADYEVPKALRYLGILEYSTELASAIDAGVEIPADSRWEQEIRAQTVAAMLMLCKKTEKPIAAMDFKIWLEGKSSSQPHHLTLTTAY